MPHFEYKGHTLDGKAVSGKVEASNEAAAAAQLFERNIMPVSLQETGFTLNQPRSQAVSKKKLRLTKIRTHALMMFSRQMYRLTKAGVPVLSSLSQLAETTPYRTLADTLQEIANDIASGKNLAQAMCEHPRVFSSLYVSIIGVGENTGRLDHAFLQVSKYLELEVKTAKRIKAALRYPIFVMITILIALMIMNFIVLPAFSKFFSRFHAQLPFPTRILIGTSDFLIHNGVFILIGIVAALFLFFRWIKAEKGRLIWDTFLLRLIIVGPLIRKIILSQFTRSFAMIMDAGIPVLKCLTLSAGSVGNRYMMNQILSMRTGIERGESLSQAAHHVSLFTPLVLQMIAVGEESGSLGEMLKEVAEYYEAEVDYALDSLSTSIEPILISIIAVMVLILALGIFLPTWHMLTALQGK